MEDLLRKVKLNLILEHSKDDELLRHFISAAITYAEVFQNAAVGTYLESGMPPTTEQAVIMMASHFYESRDGSTGGFYSDSVAAGQQVRNAIDSLLMLDVTWKF
ncbi:MAG: head-tail connector protein [Oscillospiraceae bacterium]|nr:head-tail connector protein [Oscillospiraceae bacterium]